jgi:Fission yeast centromere protein N-terminal domain
MPRRPISSEQRAALRFWYYSHEPRPTQAEAARWFQNEFNHKVSQSTISESVSSKYAHLDATFSSSTDASTALSTSYRNRRAQWPILEASLNEWKQSLEENVSESQSTNWRSCTDCSAIQSFYSVHPRMFPLRLSLQGIKII